MRGIRFGGVTELSVGTEGLFLVCTRPHGRGGYHFIWQHKQQIIKRIPTVQVQIEAWWCLGLNLERFYSQNGNVCIQRFTIDSFKQRNRLFVLSASVQHHFPSVPCSGFVLHCLCHLAWGSSAARRADPPAEPWPSPCRWCPPPEDYSWFAPPAPGQWQLQSLQLWAEERDKDTRGKPIHFKPVTATHLNEATGLCSMFFLL